MMKILLVEDDETLSMGIEYSLKNDGFEVECAYTLKQAEEKYEDVDMILLDVTLPDGTGYDLCRKVRKKSEVPIIFLTACDEEVNIVLGLDMGADDYITKPVRIRELTARIKAVARRKSKNTSNDMITFRNLTIYPLKYEVYKDGEKIQLTTMEYKLLLMMIKNMGNVLTRKQLLSSLWDVDGDFIEEKTLTVYIKRLREKLKEDKNCPYIETIRGIGYRIAGV
ncbi:MAG: response regulator transcription factor [Inconstantimicrobium porci]|uniref:response regulator transcription factor n=1 Tax=Inconstantimicrobium porci TaxID=2652291 RepID=UPI002A920959|nr:response regulator transcription factor [Inconstantimicrobium porci]MDY5913515.1 response regulator transcription factor [Inconstantimicrobium porci]